MIGVGGGDVPPDQAGHDEVAIGLGALGVRLDVVAVLEVLVDDLALGRAHRVQRDRAAGAHGVGGGLVGLALQRLLAALAVAGGVDDHAHARGRRVVAGRGLEREVLDGVDRLAVAADEQPEVVALERGPDLPALLARSSPSPGARAPR